jgi:hypothetical protein
VWQQIKVEQHIPLASLFYVISFMHLKPTSKRLPFTILVFSIIVGFSVPAFSQDSTYKSSRPVFIQTSLFYDFPQSYGITAGMNWPLKATIKSHISKNGDMVIKSKDLFFSLLTGVYRYPLNYTGVLLVPAIGIRHNVKRSFFYETSLGIGVLRTFYDGKVYQVNASGNVSEKSLFGRFYATTHLSTAFNFQLQKLGNRNMALQLKPSLWFQYPYNSFIKPHVSLEAGIKYELNSHSTNTRKIIKHMRK